MSTKRDQLLVALGKAAGQAEVVEKLIGYIIRTLPDDWSPRGTTRAQAADAFVASWRQQKEYFEGEIARMLKPRKRRRNRSQFEERAP
jgi:hypothetical protein